MSDLVLVASWADVRAKAKRIRRDGGVRILVAGAMNIVAQVRGDTEVYQTELTLVPGRRQLAIWACGCAWAAYSWGRTGPWRRFEGRQCSHSLATLFEAQARGMMGRQVEVDETQPHWLDPLTVRQPGSYDRDTGKHSMMHAVGKDGPAEFPTHAGLVLKARDTGRVMMLQRSMRDPDDPNGGRWEFPGGGLEPGDHNTLHGAMREWQEEIGQPVPGGVVTHTWTSPNGVYQGHVMVIPSEDSVSFKDGRVTVNPDDPDGDDHEQAAWWDPEHAQKNPALRDECKGSPWKEIKMASTAAWGPGPERFAEPGAEEFGDLPAPLSGVDDDPEHALPVAYGDEHLAALVSTELLRTASRRVAVRDFSSAEQLALIQEGAGQRAANLDRLDLAGTHYQYLPGTDDDELWGI